MKTLAFLTSGLAFSGLLLGAHAQTPTTTSTSASPTKTAAQTADRRAANYKGPKVVKSTKALGSKMLRDSKPAPRTMDIPVTPLKK